MAGEGAISALGTHVRSISGKEVYFDKEGYFLCAHDWTEEMVEVLSGEMGIGTLSQGQWQVIHFLRAYYLGNGKAPLHSELKTGLGCSLMELESMFPGGIRKGARLLAGLPNPQSCNE